MVELFKVTTAARQYYIEIGRARQRREIDPTIRVLRECLADLGKGRKADKLTRERLQSMLDFFEECSGFFGEIQRVPNGLMRFMRLGAKVRRLLGVG